MYMVSDLYTLANNFCMLLHFEICVSRVSMMDACVEISSYGQTCVVASSCYLWLSSIYMISIYAVPTKDSNAQLLFFASMLTYCRGEATFCI